MTLMADRDGSFVFPVADLEVRFIRPRLARGGVHSGVWSDVAVSHGGAHVHEARYNLSSLTSRRELAKYLASRAELPKPLNWTDAIETAATLMCREMHRGKTPVDLSQIADPGEPRYVVKPLVLRDQLTLMFGDAEGGKSQLACAVAWAVSTGDSLLLSLHADREDCWYLDWETDENEVTRRLTRLSRGVGTEEVPTVQYLHMDRPLADDGETVRQLTHGLVIIDSLAPACGGDTIGPEGATNFWNCLRGIPASVLCIAQTQKNANGGKGKTVFGSGMFTYMARSVWEIVSACDGDAVHVAAFHRKSNVGRKWPAIAWRFEHDDTARTTQVVSEEPDAVAEFSARLAPRDRIIDLLRSGKRTAGDIAAELDIEERIITRILINESKWFVRVPNGEWANLEKWRQP